MVARRRFPSSFRRGGANRRGDWFLPHLNHLVAFGTAPLVGGRELLPLLFLQRDLQPDSLFANFGVPESTLGRELLKFMAGVGALQQH
jgi:hypothetical protein